MHRYIYSSILLNQEKVLTSLCQGYMCLNFIKERMHSRYVSLDDRSIIRSNARLHVPYSLSRLCREKIAETKNSEKSGYLR